MSGIFSFFRENDQKKEKFPDIALRKNYLRYICVIMRKNLRKKFCARARPETNNVDGLSGSYARASLSCNCLTPITLFIFMQFILINFMQYGNLKFYVGNFISMQYGNLKFIMLLNFISMQYGNFVILRKQKQIYTV